jgi:hypothetical protein
MEGPADRFQVVRFVRPGDKHARIAPSERIAQFTLTADQRSLREDEQGDLVLGNQIFDGDAIDLRQWGRGIEAVVSEPAPPPPTPTLPKRAAATATAALSAWADARALAHGNAAIELEVRGAGYLAAGRAETPKAGTGKARNRDHQSKAVRAAPHQRYLKRWPRPPISGYGFVFAALRG